MHDDYLDRSKLRLQIHEAMMKGTPRYRRANVFANNIQAMLRDWLPHDGVARERIFELLLETGFLGNLEIIEVPPECDEFDKLRLERARYERHAVLAGVDRNAPLGSSAPSNGDQG